MARPQHRPRYDRWRIWHAGTQHHVRASSIVVADPGFQYKPQMGFRQWNEPIQAFSTDGADQPLADAVRHRTAGGIFSTRNPKLPTEASSSTEKMLSRSWIR